MVNSICDWTRTQLSAYVDGELQASVSARVSDHLGACPNCRNRCREESDLVRTAVHTLVAAEPPRDFSVRLQSAIASPATGVPAEPVPEDILARNRRHRLPWGHAAAALLLSLLWIPFQFDADRPAESVVSTSDVPPTVTVAPLAKPAEPIVQLRRGDFDGDGEFNLADVERLRQYLEDPVNFSAERLCAPAIDFDEDGELTPWDLRLATGELLGEAGGGDVVLFRPNETQLACAMNTCF